MTAVVGPAKGAGSGSGISDGLGGEMLASGVGVGACSLPVLKMGAEVCVLVPKARTTQLEHRTRPGAAYKGRRAGWRASASCLHQPDLRTDSDGGVIKAARGRRTGRCAAGNP